MDAPPPIPNRQYNATCNRVDHTDYKAARVVYNNMMQHTDYTVERILALLELHNITLENSVFALLGDNGGFEAFGGDAWSDVVHGAKGTVYNGGIMVPAAIAGMGVPKGVRYGHLMHAVDLFPTLIQAAGWKVVSPPDTHGFSVWDGIQWTWPCAAQ